MRISFNLEEFTLAITGHACVQYDVSENQLVFEDRHGEVVLVPLDGLDFTLHDKCELPAPAALVNNLQVEVGSVDGLYLDMRQIVELVDAAREA